MTNHDNNTVQSTEINQQSTEINQWKCTLSSSEIGEQAFYIDTWAQVISVLMEGLDTLEPYPGTMLNLEYVAPKEL